MFPTIDKRATGVNLRRMMDARGITVKEVQEYLGLGSIQSVYHWINGISMPTIDNLYAMSELFQVPIDAMVCGSRPNYLLGSESEDAYYRRIFAYFTKLSEKRVA